MMGVPAAQPAAAAVGARLGMGEDIGTEKLDLYPCETNLH